MHESRYIPKNIDTNVNHGDEESNTLEEVADEQHAHCAGRSRIQYTQDVCRNDTDEHLCFVEWPTQVKLNGEPTIGKIYE